MNEYVCELPFDDVVSFGSGNIQIPVRERITRCRHCVYFWPGVNSLAIDWCSCGDCIHFGRCPMRKGDGSGYCWQARRREADHGE